MRGSRVKKPKANKPTHVLHTHAHLYSYLNQPNIKQSSFGFTQCYGFKFVFFETGEWGGHTHPPETRENSCFLVSSVEAGKTQPQRQNTRCHIPLTRNSTVSRRAPRLSFLFVPVGFSLKTQAAFPKNSSTPLEKYRFDSRKHCSIRVLSVAWLLRIVQASLTKSHV